jgi:creatinine amidohydrolase
MSRGLSAALILSASSGFARAVPSTSLSPQNPTGTELRADIAVGRTAIRVPLGGTEQDGPQLALGKLGVDLVVARTVAAIEATTARD